jgi:hypothetical protein
LQKCSSILQRWCCSCKLRSRRIGSCRYTRQKCVELLCTFEPGWPDCERDCEKIS